nr:unnamed protein product [Callosobruchus chinensis]
MTVAMMVVLPLEAPMRHLDVTGGLSVAISSSLVAMVAMLTIMGRMLGMAFSDHHRFESSVRMGSVLDYAMGTIWFLEHVLADHLLSFPVLELAFEVVENQFSSTPPRLKYTEHLNNCSHPFQILLPLLVPLALAASKDEGSENDVQHTINNYHVHENTEEDPEYKHDFPKWYTGDHDFSHYTQYHPLGFLAKYATYTPAKHYPTYTSNHDIDHNDLSSSHDHDLDHSSEHDTASFLDTVPSGEYNSYHPTVDHASDIIPHHYTSPHFHIPDKSHYEVHEDLDEGDNPYAHHVPDTGHHDHDTDSGNHHMPSSGHHTDSGDHHIPDTSHHIHTDSGEHHTPDTGNHISSVPHTGSYVPHISSSAHHIDSAEHEIPDSGNHIAHTGSYVPSVHHIPDTVNYVPTISHHIPPVGHHEHIPDTGNHGDSSGYHIPDSVHQIHSGHEDHVGDDTGLQEKDHDSGSNFHSGSHIPSLHESNGLEEDSHDHGGKEDGRDEDGEETVSINICINKKECSFILLKLDVFMGLLKMIPTQNEKAVNYNFGYGVHDPLTGDHKSQYEERNGDQVTGQYMLKEPNGQYRIVKYSAAPHTGFQAKVEYVDA